MVLVWIMLQKACAVQQRTRERQHRTPNVNMPEHCSVVLVLEATSHLHSHRVPYNA